MLFAFVIHPRRHSLRQRRNKERSDGSQRIQC